MITPEIWFLWAGWVVYFFFHSLFADLSVKEKVFGKFPSFEKYYRLVYNGLSIIGLASLLHFQYHLPSPYWFHVGGELQVTGVLITIKGLFLLVLSFRNYDLSEFSGFSYLKGESGEPTLNKEGFNSLVRHPLYFSTIILLTGFLFFAPNIKNVGFVGITFGYLYIGTILEERKLILEFGKAYQQYQEEVPMLIPFLGK